jgi:hypothetical protein
MDCSKCPKLSAESQKVSNQNKQIEILEGRLKLCRLAMRQHDIGHLYPGTTQEYEDNIKRGMAAGGIELTQTLYFANKFNQLKSSQEIQTLKENIKKLLEFIESKGITAKELKDFLEEGENKDGLLAIE